MEVAVDVEEVDGFEVFVVVVVVNVVPVLVEAVLVLDVLVVAVVVVEGLPPEPRYCTTSSWNPGFLYSWLISHIITPPKLAKPWL